MKKITREKIIKYSLASLLCTAIILGIFSMNYEKIEVYDSPMEYNVLDGETICEPNTYYIDFDYGNDLNNGTCTTSAWKHSPGDSNATGIPLTTTLQPGDTVLFKGGVIYPNKLEILTSGDIGNFITFSGSEWGSDKAILEGSALVYETETFAFDISASYIIIDGFEIRNRKSAGILGTKYGSSNIIIQNNLIHNIGNINSIAGSAVYFVGFNNVNIENNEIYNTSYTAINFANDNSNISIVGNNIYNGQVDGIGYGVSNGLMIIDNNTIHGFNNNINHGDGMQILKFPDVLIITNNIMYDNGQQIFIEPYANPPNSVPAGKVYVYNNILYCTSATPTGQCGNGIGVSAHNHVQEVYIFNNVIIGFRYGWGGLSVDARSELLAVLGQTKPFGTVQINNNILFDSKASSMNAMNLSDSFDWDYDLFYASDFSNYLPGNGDNGGDLIQFKLEHPTLEVNAVYANPLFLNDEVYDFRLQPISPAIDAGIPILEFNHDILGNSRPQGAGWDIGAYEYCEGAGCVIVYLPVCGNGIKDNGEECDDGNLVNGDGCNSSCQVEVLPNGTIINDTYLPGNSKKSEGSGGGGRPTGFYNNTNNITKINSSSNNVNNNTPHQEVHKPVNVSGIINTLGGGESPKNKALGWTMFISLIGVLLFGIAILIVAMVNKIKRMNMMNKKYFIH